MMIYMTKLWKPVIMLNFIHELTFCHHHVSGHDVWRMISLALHVYWKLGHLFAHEQRLN